MSNSTVAYHTGFACDKRSCTEELKSAAKPQTDELIAERITAAKKKKWRFFKTGRRLTVVCPKHKENDVPKTGIAL